MMQQIMYKTVEDNPASKKIAIVSDDEVDKHLFIADVLRDLEALSLYCNVLGARATEILVRRTIKRINEYDDSLTYETFEVQLVEMRSRLKDELESSFLFSLQPELAKYYTTAREYFGDEVMTALTEENRDELEEALRCLALSRASASVYHLMRVIEEVVHALGQKLTATVVDSSGKYLNWGIILANMEGKLSKLPDHNEQREWSEIKSFLYSLNIALRTPTMHPKRHYTLEQAVEIMEASKAFIRRLVLKL
jgi:hypothetical protein